MTAARFLALGNYTFVTAIVPSQSLGVGFVHHHILALSILLLMGSSPACADPIDSATPISSPDERLEHFAREAIIDSVNSAIGTRDFAALDAMDERFRTSRARTPAGFWNLAIYHHQLRYRLSQNLNAATGCVSGGAQFVAQWHAASPHSPAAAIAEAALLMTEAWCTRGGGYASEVEEGAWPKFHAKMEAAANVLTEHREQASRDPQFYVMALELIRAQGMDRDEFAAVMAEATAREPAYVDIYTTAATNLLPPWGGSYIEIDALAQLAIKKSEETEGTGIYAQIFRTLAECGCDVIAYAARWATLKQSMREVYERYPVRNNAEYFADLSCRMGDAQEGRRYIRAQHPEASGHGDLAALFDACDKQAREEQSLRVTN